MLAAGVPDLTFLKDLPPGTANLALVTVLVVTVLFYVGPVLRDRLSKTAPPPTLTPGEASTEQTAQLPAAMRPLPELLLEANVQNERFLNHVLGQLAEETREKQALEKRVEALQAEVQRLLFLQRGNP